ncbi:hypothetical protein M0R45_035565 [Rubus argutus]|uniref:F-box domain-containing protein n=1 Tax=Rubus argutus TaxID=59490 RepID=A0AAW1VXX7_RUBAR
MGTKRNRYSLDEDLILEIFSRLPVKSLMRFRCVSKEWYSLTKNSYLINIHLWRSDSKLCYLLAYTSFRDERFTKPKIGISRLGDEATDIVSLNLSFLYCYTNSINSITIVGSSNGLVCLVTRAQKKTRSYMDGGEIIIWNPATKQSRSLPKPVIAENFNRHDGATFGFGFSDHNTNDYKLVGIFRKQVQVFTRSTNCWKEIEGKGFPSCKYCYRDDWISSKNGVLYWFATTSGPMDRFVLSFSLRDEVFHVIKLPSWGFLNRRLLSWKNSLACIIGNNEQVWAKTTDDSAWTKQFSIDSSILRRGEIFGIWKDQVVIWRTEKSRNDPLIGLFLYDPKTKKRGQWIPKHEVNNYYGYVKLVDYVESLVLV